MKLTRSKNNIRYRLISDRHAYKDIILGCWNGLINNNREYTVLEILEDSLFLHTATCNLVTQLRKGYK